VRAGDGSASLRAAEQWANLLARRGAGRSNRAQGRAEIHAAIAHLQQLAALHPTVERESLLGSAWKRLAMIDEGKAAQEALRHMVEHYARAEVLGRDEGASNLFYPIMNGMAGELRLAALRGQTGVELDGARVGAARQSLQDAVNRAPDFWSVVGLVELQWLQAAAAKRLAAARDSVAEGFEDLAQRVPSPHLWKSARDQAHFVLLPYAAAAGGAEAAAAKAVLKQLDDLAR
jgi:hypothetical protein